MTVTITEIGGLLRISGNRLEVLTEMLAQQIVSSGNVISMADGTGTSIVAFCSRKK